MLGEISSILTFPVLDLTWPEFTAGDLNACIILTVFAALFALEARWGYRKSAAKTARQSYLSNLGTFILNDTMMSLMSISSLWVLAERFGHLGLLSWIADPMGKALVSFLLLDLTLYVWHRANHRFDCLWMFHKVHHSDRCMNVSTAFRLHFVEVVLTTLVKASFVLLMGVDAAVLLANEAVITLFILFHHANIRFAGEHWLGRLTIVPYLHRVHHSAQRKEHDSNYGAVFSFWDRIFGTLAELEPAEIGLKHVPSLGVIELLRFGLTRVELPAMFGLVASSLQDATPDRRSATKTVAANPRQSAASTCDLSTAELPSPPCLRAMIAEAAYYRAEKRGFAPGDDMLDWFKAEEEIMQIMDGFRKPKLAERAGRPQCINSMAQVA